MKVGTFALNALLAIAGTTMLTGCGAINFVKGAQVNSYAQNGDQYGELSVDLNTSSLVFPTLTIPIVNPNNPAQTDGSVSIVNSATGAELDITVDISAVANLPKAGSSALLPNGANIPVTNYNAASLLTYKVGSSEIYVDLNSASNQAMFGAALVISEFNIGTNVDLFIPFAEGAVSGSAGVFTSATSGESGFAVFADVSSVLSSLSSLATGSTGTSLNALSLAAPRMSVMSMKVPVSSSSAKSQYSFLAKTPNSSGMNQLNGMLKTLKSNKTQLHVQ